MNTPKTTQEELDQLLDDHFREHQDYIYNKHATQDFLEAATELIKSQQQSLLDRVNLEIIGETEVALNRPKAATRNELKREQRKKLEEVRSNL